MQPATAHQPDEYEPVCSANPRGQDGFPSEMRDQQQPDDRRETDEGYRGDELVRLLRRRVHESWTANHPCTVRVFSGEKNWVADSPTSTRLFKKEEDIDRTPSSYLTTPARC